MWFVLVQDGTVDCQAFEDLSIKFASDLKTHPQDVLDQLYDLLELESTSSEQVRVSVVCQLLYQNLYHSTVSTCVMYGIYCLQVTNVEGFGLAVDKHLQL